MGLRRGVNRRGVRGRLLLRVVPVPMPLAPRALRVLRVPLLLGPRVQAPAGQNAIRALPEEALPERMSSIAWHETRIQSHSSRDAL